MKYALNVAAVYQYTMTQSSTMTALMHVHRVLLESLDANVIRSAALHTSGAAGTSGLMHLDGEGYIFHSRQHPLSSAIPLP